MFSYIYLFFINLKRYIADSRERHCISDLLYTHLMLNAIDLTVVDHPYLSWSMSWNQLCKFSWKIRDVWVDRKVCGKLQKWIWKWWGGGGKLKDMTGRGQAFKNIDKHKTERLLKYPFLQPFYKFSFSQLLPQKWESLPLWSYDPEYVNGVPHFRLMKGGWNPSIIVISVANVRRYYLLDTVVVCMKF